MKEGHRYLRTHTIGGAAVHVAVSAEDEALRARARQAASGRAAKTLVKEGPLRITIIALRRGTLLHEHSVAGPFSVQVLRGRAHLTAGDDEFVLHKGAIVAFPAETPHSVEAHSDCALLITVVVNA